MSKAILHLMHKDEIMIKLEKELSLLSHANKNPEINKPCCSKRFAIQRLEGSIDALKWVLGFDYIKEKSNVKNVE